MAGTYTSPSWSGLPTDILLSILQCLELPQAIVFALVCKSWRSAATVAGIPHSGTPWLMSWRDLLEERKDQVKGSSAVTCKFRHLLDVDKVYDGHVCFRFLHLLLLKLARKATICPRQLCFSHQRRDPKAIFCLGSKSSARGASRAFALQGYKPPHEISI